MTVAFMIFLLLVFLDESGILLMLGFVLALLFGASYVAGLGWHAAT